MTTRTLTDSGQAQRRRLDLFDASHPFAPYTVTIHVRNDGDRQIALDALRDALGGRWAVGVGNTYPEDYTILDQDRAHTLVRAGDRGEHRVVARIIHSDEARCDLP